MTVLLTVYTTRYADSEVVVVKPKPFNDSTVLQYDSKKNYTLDELDDMFATFHSLERIMKVINKPEYRDLIEVKELLQLYNQKMDSMNRMLNATAKNNTTLHPLIVIDTMYNYDRDVAMELLMDRIGCICIKTIPSYLVPLYRPITGLNFEVEHAFRAIVLYLIANQVRLLRKEKPVVISRYWHNEFAFTLAHQYNGFGVLPGVSSLIYSWPHDLLKPDIVYFVDTVQTYHRFLPQKIRLMMRDVYKRIKDPETVLMSDHLSSFNTDEVVYFITEDLEKKKLVKSKKKEIRINLRRGVKWSPIEF